MAIRVGEAAVIRVCELGDGFALQVQRPSDLAGALEALRRARHDLVGLGAAWASGVVAAPAGPLLFVDAGGVGDDARRAVPDLVVRHLEAVGVRDAVVEAPLLGGSLDRLDRFGPALVLRLFPGAGARTLPPAWIDVAAEWIGSGLVGDDVVRARVLSVESDVVVADVAGLLHECAIAGATCEVVTGDLSRRIRAGAVSVGRDGYPHIALAAGGPHLDDEDVIAQADLLEDVARELAPQLAYACLDIEPTFGGLATGPAVGGLAVLSALAGRCVPEPFPFQVLGPGHIHRLGGPPPGAVALGGGRYEVRLDDPGGEDGRILLGACLPEPGEVERGLREAPEAEPAVVPAAVDDDAADEGVGPAAVDAFVRWWRDTLRAAGRQRLDQIEHRAAAMAEGPAGERRRRWVVAEWLVKEHAAAWLRAAGAGGLADELAGLGPLADPDELVRAVDVLGAFDGGDGGEDDEVDDAWEAAADQAAWTAAAEAVTGDVDDHVVTSTELAAGDEAWRAARLAMADVVWRRAWEAGDAEVGRSLRPVLDDDDNRDLELAGRDALALADAPDWDAAVAATPAWVDEARAAVEAAGWEWEKAVDGARSAAADLLVVAPDHVARAVLVAMAGAASARAGRLLARTDPEALTAVVDELRDSAFALLERLLEP